SDTVMRIEALPQRVVILGGGFIAAEFAHIFAAYGCAVSVISRSEPLLRRMDQDIAARFTEQARQQWDLHPGAQVSPAERITDGIRVDLVDGTHVEADLLLVATGRRPNSHHLNLAAAGVQAHPDGRI